MKKASSRCVLTCVSVLNALLLCGESFVLSVHVPGRRPSPYAISSSFHNDNQSRNNQLFLSQRGGAFVETATETPVKEEIQENQQEQQQTLPKNHIEVSSQIDLPFSAEIAFDAFSDLPRQASWSPWLTSVKYVSQGSSTPPETKWTMKSILGVSYSWNAISTRLERPYVIEWESSKGLKNWGRVEFVKQTAEATRMQLTLTFVAPRLVARFFQNQDGGLSRLVQQRIVGNTLRNFRRVVLDEDVPKKALEAAADEKKKEREVVLLGPPRERYQSIVKDRP